MKLPVSMFRNIGHDLVEKRLWPVALALVAVLIALPFLLGGSDPVTPAPAGASPLAGATPAGQAAVSLDTTLPAGETARGGKVRNPFRQRGVKAAQAAPAAPTTTNTSPDSSTGASGTSAGAAPGTAAGTGSGTAGGAPTPSSAPKPDTLDTYRLTLRFGRAGNLRTMRDLARLSPLPSDSNPFFVYLGVLKDGKTAVFLISSDVTATGDGKCRPSATNCQTIEVKQGDTEFFDMDVDGKPVQYEMDILHLDKTSNATTTTAGAARAAARRHSVAGAAALRDAHARQSDAFDGMDGYRWLPDRGVLTRAPAQVKGSGTGPSAGKAQALPGLPVWHAELTV